MLPRSVALLSFLLLTSACGNANWQSIHRTFQLTPNDAPQSVLIDAKQRAIISTTITRYGQTYLYVCAEPSPDALAVISSSLSQAGQLSIEKNPRISEAFAFAVQESAAQLNRGRTIQLLRDGLFRACEASLNGALEGGEYGQIANKYADATVTLLAIEQITSPGFGATVGATSGPLRTDVNAPPLTSQPTSPTDSTTKRDVAPTPNVRKDTQSVGPTSPDSGNTPAPDPQSKIPSQPAETQKQTPRSQSTEQKPQDQTRGAPTDGGKVSPGTVVMSPAQSQPPVPPAIAVIVQSIVGQFLTSQAQNTCIKTFSDPRFGVPTVPFAGSEKEPTIDPSVIEAAKTRMEKLGTYCDSLFKGLGETSFSQAVKSLQELQTPAPKQIEPGKEAPDQQQQKK